MKYSKLMDIVKKWFPLFMTYVWLMSCICLLWWNEDGALHIAKVKFLSGAVGSCLMAALLVACGARLRVLRWGISSLLWLLTVCDVFCFFQYRSHISERIVRFIFQTDATEAGEFLTGALSTWQAIVPMAAVTVSAIAIYYISRAIVKYIGSMSYRAVVIMMAFAGCLSAAVMYIGLFTTMAYDQMSLPTVSRLAYSVYGYISSRPEMASLEEATVDAEAYIHYDADAPGRVVWVIGESFNRNHSPLYGYRLPTTPRLQKEYDKGNITVYNDVVTPYRGTAEVMNVIFSPHTAGDTLAWECQPLLPTLFKKAGYVVTMHDNQTARIGGDGVADGSAMFFFNSDVVEGHSFDYRNEGVETYDLPFTEREVGEMGQGTHNLDIFHYKGQHIQARNRYPEAAGIFDADDYGYREDLTDDQKSAVAEYDNATAYFDRTLGVIFDRIGTEDAILVFHSDHGEEVYDYRDRYGRTLEPVTAEMARNIFNVPLLVYTTPMFRNLHPKLYQRIVSGADKPVTLEDMAHMLMGIGGISCRWYKPGRSVLSADYDAESPRLLEDAVDFDSLMSVSHLR